MVYGWDMGSGSNSALCLLDRAWCQGHWAAACAQQHSCCPVPPCPARPRCCAACLTWRACQGAVVLLACGPCGGPACAPLPGPAPPPHPAAPLVPQNAQLEAAIATVSKAMRIQLTPPQVREGRACWRRGRERQAGARNGRAQSLGPRGPPAGAGHARAWGGAVPAPRCALHWRACRAECLASGAAKTCALPPGCPRTLLRQCCKHTRPPCPGCAAPHCMLPFACWAPLCMFGTHVVCPT